MNNRHGLLTGSAGVFVAALLAATGPLAAAETLSDALVQGKPGISLRYRFEYVDQDPFAENAEASTLRGRLNYRTADWKGFAAFAEFDYIGNIGWDDYDEGGGNTPDRSQYPVVADPVGEDLNQAWLQWSNATGALLRAGRQRILYDNQRFVGNVGWRQNEQTFDSVYFQKKTSSGLDFQVGYLWQVNRIFGNDVPVGENEGDFWLGNLAQEWKDIGRLTGYYYDLDNDDAPGFSTRTYGLRFAGSRKLDTMTFGYAAEYAYQEDAHNNAVDYDADYYRFDLALGFAKVTPYIGYEVLGGDRTRAGTSFRTPLATLHAFNGWADLFLNTPAAGLEDLFGGLKGTIAGWAWDVIYHEFDAESGSVSFGSELDASLSRPFAKHYSILFKAAWFDGDTGSPYLDTTKLWLQLTADF